MIVWTSPVQMYTWGTAQETTSLTSLGGNIQEFERELINCAMLLQLYSVSFTKASLIIVIIWKTQDSHFFINKYMCGCTLFILTYPHSLH